MRRCGLLGIIVVLVLFMPMNTIILDNTQHIDKSIDNGSDTSILAEGQGPYTGTGAAETAVLQGLSTNDSVGPLLIDSSSSAYGYVDLPSGWSGTNIQANLDYSSMWVNDILDNANIDDYHTERWPDTGSTTTFSVPDSWTLFKHENSISGDDHPTLGNLEFNSGGSSFDGSMGWFFESAYGAGVTVEPTDEVFLEQMIDIPYKSLQTVDIEFMYRVTSSSSLSNQTYLFIRLGDYEQRFFFVESGDTTDTWIIEKITIPGTEFDSLITPTSIPFDFGISTELSGVQATGRNTYIYIDEIHIDCEVSPFADQIDLKANTVAIGSMTSGSVSPYVPEDANRDATDSPATGVDLDGASGRFYVGIQSASWNTWESGFQFPLSIPQGAIITSAYLEVEAGGTTGTYVDMRLSIAEQDTVGVFVTGIPHMEDAFTWSNSSVDWDVTAWTANTRYSSPDITNLIQGVIGRSGWSSGNYIGLMLECMYSSNYNQANWIKGSPYSQTDRARLFIDYLIPVEDTVSISGSWSGSDTVSVEFTTASIVDVEIETTIILDITDTISTLDSSLSTGTSFSVDNATTVNWVANLLISPPVGVSDTNVKLSKQSSWTLAAVTDPDGDLRTGDVNVQSTEITVPSSVIDSFGIWKFEFTTSNGASNLQMRANSDSYANTATFNVGDSASFDGTATSIGGSAAQLILTDPSGSIFYSVDDLSQSTQTFLWSPISVTSSWPVGLWYAEYQFNDTAGANPTVVGTYQREFIVKHDTTLTLQSPGDAVGDQLSAKIDGDMLYVEVKLTDDANAETVTSSTVSLNWTVSGSGIDVDLEDYGAGIYGIALNTSDLENAQRWRIQISSTHQYYNDASTYFDLDLSHKTEIIYDTPAAVPYGHDAIVTFNVYDAVNENPISGATFNTNGTFVSSPTDYGNGSYTAILDTSVLSVGTYIYQINATPNETYLLESFVNVAFTVRNAYTAAFGEGGNSITTPYSIDTSMVITFNDTDDSFSGIIGASDNIENPSGIIVVTVTESTGGRYTVDFDVGTETVGIYLINITLSKSNYYDATITLALTIRAHYTSINVIGGMITPFGNNTPVTVVIWDHDTDTVVSYTNVNQLSFNSAHGLESFSSLSSYDITLATTSWTVETVSVILSVTFTSSIYAIPNNYVFDVTIRSMTTILGHEPSDLLFPTGDDFNIVLQLNVSESGIYYGDVVTGLIQSEFSVSNSSYTYPIAITELGGGRYNLTIAFLYFPEGDYTITVVVNPSSSTYAGSKLVITFFVRPARSDLTANLYTISTPYNTDANVTLTYTDLDRSEGILTATITSSDATIDYVHLGNGVYEVSIDVSGFSLGSHSVNLIADASGFNARSVIITIIVTQIHTDAEPSVISFDMPVGFTQIFYISYTDLDNNLQISGASVANNWIGSIAMDIVWSAPDSAYKVNFTTTGTDTLGIYVIWFNFTNGANYQPGYCEIEVDLRSHITIFNLVSAVEPTVINGLVNISVRYYDWDSKAGIDSANIEDYVWNGTHWITTILINEGGGFYTIRIDASQFGLGLQSFDVYFNWTGPVQQFENKTLVATVNIIGVETELALLIASEPTPYLGNMSYTLFYSDIGTGLGITNTSNPYGDGNVHIYVLFSDGSVDTSLVDILEVDFSSNAGEYTIQFNTTIFGMTGLVYMYLYINWTDGAQPEYTNRLDTISVRILPRDTSAAVIPPTPTAWGEEVSLSFTYEDVTGALSDPIANASSLSIALNISGYTLDYDGGQRLFTITFNTSEFASLGLKALSLNITWTGAPFYANQTGRIILLTVTVRQTLLDYQSPTPTSYGDTVSFTVQWLDVSGTVQRGIDGTLTLWDGASEILSATITGLGNGEYSIEFNTSYFSDPGTYALTVKLTSAEFYVSDNEATRNLVVQYRITLLSAEPVSRVAYNSSFEIHLYFQDRFTLANIGNGSGDVTITLVNGSEWYFTSEWLILYGYYRVLVQTYNHLLTIDTTYVLNISMSYDYIDPFYDADFTYVDFILRARVSALELSSTPVPTAYLDYINFTIYYWDVDGILGISGGTITVYDGGSPLSLGADYLVSSNEDGTFDISVLSTALGGLGYHYVQIRGNWTNGAPFYGNATYNNLRLSVTQRQAIAEIVSPPQIVRFLDNVTFIFRFTDTGTGTPISISVNDIVFYAEGVPLSDGDFSLTPSGSDFILSIDSEILSSQLVTNLNLTIVIDWNEATAPYYTDATTYVKISTTNRLISISLGQSASTPLGDNITLTFSLADLDYDTPVDGAIVEFNCTNPSYPLRFGDFWIINGTPGEYIILVNSSVFNKVYTTFNFELLIKWNPSISPYYANISSIQITATIRPISTVFTYDPPTPSPVQYSGTVSIILYVSDSDHVETVDIITDWTVVYYGGALDGVIPQGLTKTLLGSGMYNLSFNTNDISIINTYSISISYILWPYQNRTIHVAFQVSEISTLLIADEVTIEIDWTKNAPITVDYWNALYGNLTSGADSVTFTWAFGVGVLTEIGSTGSYSIVIDTSTGTSGTHIVTVTASKYLFSTSITTITLIVKVLPSDMVAIDPSVLTPTVSRGAAVNITMYLNDTYNNAAIPDAYVLSVYAILEGESFQLLFNGTTGFYSGLIPVGGPTILDPDIYSITITASLDSYNPTSYQFRILIEETSTAVNLIDIDNDEVNSVYSENVTITIILNAPALNENLTGASVRWYISEAGVRGNFTEIGDGVYEAVLNTVVINYGIWPVSIRATPANASYAASSATMTLTITRISTSVFRPSSLDVYWGWAGNISFTYWDDSFGEGIEGATAIYIWGLQSGNATDVGNGTYLIPIDSSLLDISNYQIRIEFILQNYQDGVGVVTLSVLQVPTSLDVLVDEVFVITTAPLQLQVPVGDTITITFFYNDTDTSDGYIGGLSGANNITQIYGPTRPLTSFLIVDLGNGYYRFEFDTSASWLFETVDGVSSAQDGPYVLRLTLTLNNRTEQYVEIQITIISIPTSYEIVDSKTDLQYGESGYIEFILVDEWAGHDGRLISGANISLSDAIDTDSIIIDEISEIASKPGHYIIRFTAVYPIIGSDSRTEFISIILDSSNSEITVLTPIRVDIIATETATMVTNIFQFGTPLGLVILLLALAYVRVLSVPKRLRQINGQIKSLKKGKMPKPVPDAKDRQELVADLFNDTYSTLDITRTSAQLPEFAVDVEVPEMGELLIQLSILTHLDATELDEFKADISKMKISEQASFVKEVIHQEAIRAARRDGIPIKEILEKVEAQATAIVSGEEIVAVSPVTPPEERFILPSTDGVESITPDDDETPPEAPRKREPFIPEEPVLQADKLKQFELDDLRADLIKKGVPLHEIDTLIEQAKDLPRDLVEEFVRSLGVDPE